MPSRKTALVTGGARRLGAAFVLDLSRRGWKVWVHYRNSRAEAEALAARVAAAGGEAVPVPADLAEPGGAEALVAALSAEPPSLVVHSASEWIEDTAASAKTSSWEQSHRLHVWSALVLARSLAASGGHLVTLLDARIRDRDVRHFSYAFAKRELALLTRYLAVELAPRVRVNGIAPGLALKAEHTSRADWAEAGREFTPLGRTGKASEVVKALRYLTDNSYVTGQILAVDGGRHLKGDLFGSL